MFVLREQCGWGVTGNWSKLEQTSLLFSLHFIHLKLVSDSQVDPRELITDEQDDHAELPSLVLILLSSFSYMSLISTTVLYLLLGHLQ